MWAKPAVNNQASEGHDMNAPINRCRDNVDVGVSQSQFAIVRNARFAKPTNPTGLKIAHIFEDFE